MNNFLISIDGNYDSNFEAEFYINKIQQIYFNKNLQISKYTIDSNLSREEILQKLNEISDLLNKNNQFVIIIGGIAEPIVKDLINFKQIHYVFDLYSDISRVYQSIKHKCKMVNILLVDKKTNPEDYMGFQKIDTMNISLGFDFKNVYVNENKFMDNYREILEILKKEGWETPPLD
jgi:hypothetical protein